MFQEQSTWTLTIYVLLFRVVLTFHILVFLSHVAKSFGLKRDGWKRAAHYSLCVIAFAFSLLLAYGALSSFSYKAVRWFSTAIAESHCDPVGPCVLD